MLGRLVAIALVSLTLPAARGVRAQSDPAPAPELREQARLRLAEGNQLFRAGDYDGAVRAYRAAYALVPSEKLHFNVGLAEKMRGNAVEATRELDRFLASEVEPASELRADARRYQDELVPLVATVRVQLAAGDHVLVDAVPIEGAANDQPIRLSPGPHQLVVRRAGHADWGQGLELAAGSNTNLVPDIAQVVVIDRAPPLAPAPAALIQTPPVTPGPDSNEHDAPAPIYRRWWFWTAVAAVVAGGAVTWALLGSDGGGGCQLSNNCVRPMRVKGLESQ